MVSNLLEQQTNTKNKIVSFSVVKKSDFLFRELKNISKDVPI